MMMNFWLLCEYCEIAVENEDYTFYFLRTKTEYKRQ